MHYDVTTMAAPYQTIDVEVKGDVHVVRPRRSSLDEMWISNFGSDLHDLIEAGGCRKLILSLRTVHCLYSNLMAKLIATHRDMEQCNGRIKLVDVPEAGQEAFRVCKLDHHFEFAPDVATALQNW